MPRDTVRLPGGPVTEAGDARRLRRLRPDELDATLARAAVAFGAGEEADIQGRWQRRIEDGNAWALADADDAVLAHCALETVDHWFGGRRVPALHVASVAVPPEHRGRGVARRLMEWAIGRGASQGLGLSLLFPATTRLYRRLGYEHAGILTRYQVDARAVPALGPSLRPAEGDDDWQAIRACHDRATSRLAGPALRPDHRWAELRRSRFAYVLDGDLPGEVVAYALFDHRRDPGDWQYTIEINDWAALTAAGLEAVAGLVGRHGTIGKGARYRAGMPSAWSLLLPEQDDELVSYLFWMARGLDLPTAIRQRGFAPGVDATVTFAVADSLLPAAAGPWRLHVSDGHGELLPSEGADVRLDARAFGPLYTGFRHPTELALAGLLRGPDEALGLLGAAFAGPFPLLFDFF